MTDFQEPVSFADDLDVACDAAEYVEGAQTPPPPDKGNYRSRITKWDYARVSKDDQSIRLTKNDAGVPTYPTIVIQEMELVEGVDRPTKIFPYQEFGLKPFKRKDFTTGLERPANNLADMLRSADATATFSNLGEGIELFKSYVASGALFGHKLDWVGKDIAFGKAQAEAVKEAAKTAGQDLQSKEVKDKVNACWKAATRKGQANFLNKTTGEYTHIYEGPSGDEIQARVEIPYDGFLPASKMDRTKFGSVIKRAAEQAAA